MVRFVDYDSRKKAVLFATISKYIKEAVPVSSEDVAHIFGLSSATIRHIFADLEEDGQLTHLYTSGGRIPTNKGYRYYVDFLVKEMQELDKEEENLVSEYKGRFNCLQLEDVLDTTSELISLLTGNTGITSFTKWQDKFFCRGIGSMLNQPEFNDIDKIRLLINMIEEKENLLNIMNRELGDQIMVYIGEELDLCARTSCSLVVANYCIKDKPSGKIAVLGPMRMEYDHVIPALEYVSHTLNEVLSDI